MLGPLIFPRLGSYYWHFDPQITDPREVKSNRSGEWDDRPPSRVGRQPSWDVVMSTTDDVADAVSASLKREAAADRFGGRVGSR